MNTSRFGVTAANSTWVARGWFLLFAICQMDPAYGDENSETNGLTRINVHEHIQSVDEAERLLSIMNEFGIQKTVLLGSSLFTITLKESDGFTQYDRNNEILMHVHGRFPDRFEAWPTINPLDPAKLEKLIALHERGATGLKLYLGHGYKRKSDGMYLFHTIPMDDPSMSPIYDYCQENFIPICYHVNTGPDKPGFVEEFVSVLTKYPDLKVICPHFMLSSINQTRLRELLEVFPNLYSDISFGHDDFLIQGLRRISQQSEKFRRLLHDYPDRFMWGSDLVLTNHVRKSDSWIRDRFNAYFDMLGKQVYTTPLLPSELLNGLALGDELLHKVLKQNFIDFSIKRPVDTILARPIEWSRISN